MFVLVLDDSELNNLLVKEAIRPIPDCEPRTFTHPEDALTFVRAHAGRIGVATIDYDMPGMNGLAFARAARSVPGFEHVPIVMVTSMDQRSLRREALEAGVTDFLGKPFDAIEIKARIANLLALDAARREQESRAGWLAREVAAATATIAAREREIIMLLMRAAEHRDTDTGDHIARVADYVMIIAERLGFDPEQCRDLSLASTMHDVGKIGVPDSILLKPGRLNPIERSEMERHADRGRKILEQSTCDIVRLAAEIAGSHHERWDGTGYPLGLKGEAIPLSGRIVAVADVFDALTSDRPYKRAWGLEAARTFLVTHAGQHFDPACVEAFLAEWPRVAAIASSRGDGVGEDEPDKTSEPVRAVLR